MAYTNNIPASTDLISTSQGQIQANFTAIDSGTTGTGIGFARNHITMTDGTNGGLHNRVDYYQAVSSPSISGFVSSAYAKTVTHAELFYKNATQDMQVTNSLLTAASGEGMLPGGLQIRSGSGSSNGAGISNSFSTAFPTGCIAVTATGRNASQPTNDIKVTAISTTAFTAKSAAGEAIYYIAIGY